MHALSAPLAPSFVDLLGRRAAPRLHLSIPARLLSVCETQNCMLVDISRTGARLTLARPLAVKASGYLRVGPIEVFVTAVRVREGEAGMSTNGVEFDTPLAKSQVLAVRSYAANYEMAERRAFLLQARDWIMGGL